MKINALLLFLFLLTSSCENPQKENSNPKPEEEKTTKIIKPIPLDKATLSGLNLKPVTNKNEPDRKLFQRNLFNGSEIMVFVVSSETASAIQNDYSFDEFIYLFNGQARQKLPSGKEVNYHSGDFFITPKGFSGEWETIGATEFHYELSIITKQRSKVNTENVKALPYLVDKEKLSGIGITKTDNEIESYKDVVFKGIELEVVLESEASTKKSIPKTTFEQMIYVQSGTLSLTPTGGEEQTFYTGDFFVLPKGFEGEWESKGHHLFRSLSVRKSK